MEYLRGETINLPKVILKPFSLFIDKTNKEQNILHDLYREDLALNFAGIVLPSMLDAQLP